MAASIMRMLVVDDEPALRKALCDQFTEENFTVDSAPDGVVALEQISSNHYDIVLLDLQMPRMGGMEVLKKLKDLKKRPHVIVLTIVDDINQAQACLSLGARDYISKPYDPNDLLHVVIKVLSA